MSSASAAANEVPLLNAAPVLKKLQQSERDRSDSLESMDSQASTQSQPVVENKNVSFAEKPIELEKKHSPPDLKKQTTGILKQSKSTPPAAASSDSNATALPSSRATAPPPSNTKPAAHAPSNHTSPGTDQKHSTSAVAAANAAGDAKAAQSGKSSLASGPGKLVSSGSSIPVATQQFHTSASSVKVGAPLSTPSPPTVILPGNIAHLQPAVTSADSSRGDTLEWNVAMDSSDGADMLAAPGPSTLHSIDKMYRSMSTMPPSFSQSTLPTIRPSLADAAAPQSTLDEAALKAKAREKIKQFVVGDISSSSFASGAPQFVSSSRPAVTRSFSAPSGSISQPSLASNQSWQMPSFVTDNSFAAQQQAFPAPNRPLADTISSIWGGTPSATPAPFTAPLSTSSWGMGGPFSSVSPQQDVAVSQISGLQQQPSATDENLFFFESIDE
jgi:hypothetical protein